MGNPLAGSTSLNIGVADPRGNATPIAAGDLVLIIQIQGADIDASNTDAYGNNICRRTCYRLSQYKPRMPVIMNTILLQVYPVQLLHSVIH